MGQNATCGPSNLNLEAPPHPSEDPSGIMREIIEKRYSDIMHCSGVPIRFEYQHFFTLPPHGFESVGGELLVRPMNGMRVDYFLEMLKQQGKTFDLFHCVLCAMQTLDSGDHLVSVNAYLGDIESPIFQDSIGTELPFGMAIEFLEDGPGLDDGSVLGSNGMLIQNIRWLKENGFRIAIDDFPAGSSREILKFLKKHDIKIDIIKIDGKCAERFYQKKPSEHDEEFVSDIAGELERIALEYPIVCIIEWIQDVAHAREMLRRLNPSDNPNITFYFQGMNIKIPEHGY